MSGGDDESLLRPGAGPGRRRSRLLDGRDERRARAGRAEVPRLRVGDNLAGQAVDKRWIGGPGPVAIIVQVTLAGDPIRTAWCAAHAAEYRADEAAR